MSNKFIFTDAEFEIVGAQSVSIGQGIETTQKKSYDFSKNPQSITYRKKTTAKTGSISAAVNRSAGPNIFEWIPKFEALAGKIGRLVWDGADLGNFCVKSVQFSFALDAVDVISSISIGMEIQEGYVKDEAKTKKAAKTEPPASYALL